MKNRDSQTMLLQDGHSQSIGAIDQQTQQRHFQSETTDHQSPYFQSSKPKHRKNVSSSYEVVIEDSRDDIWDIEAEISQREIETQPHISLMPQTQTQTQQSQSKDKQALDPLIINCFVKF